MDACPLESLRRPPTHYVCVLPTARAGITKPHVMEEETDARGGQALIPLQVAAPGPEIRRGLVNKAKAKKAKPFARVTPIPQLSLA